MAEYIDREDVISNLYCWNEHKLTINRKDFNSIPTADVIERERIDKAIEEIKQLKHQNTDVEGYRWWNNAIDNAVHILKSMVSRSLEG